MTLRLNIDLGEMPDEPEALYALAHLANLACGAHAGDDAITARAVALARTHDIAVGAHPSFPDRARFGRVAMHLDDAALRATIRAQLAWLRARCDLPLTHMKPHGALYHAADRDPAIARALLDETHRALGDVAIVGPPGGALQSTAHALSRPFLREGFADRGYRDDHTLIPRGEPGALLTDPDAVRAQVRRLVASHRYDTLCVHGDGPDAVTVARATREAMT